MGGSDNNDKKRYSSSSKQSSNGNGFQSLGLSNEVYRGIVLRMGFRMPTPVQRKALPVILSGVDAVVMARTGSGKTCAFLVPLLEKLLNSSEGGSSHCKSEGVRAVVLSPTRELSQQTLRVLHKLVGNGSNNNNTNNNINAIGIHGGEGMEQQFALLSSRPDVIVATPGRLAHHLSEIPDFNLAQVQMLVLDEADRLMEMGFGAQIREIARSMSASICQKVLLSATMPKQLVEFTKQHNFFANDTPHIVRLDSEAQVSDELRIGFFTCRSGHDKDAALLQVMELIQQDTALHQEQQQHQANNNNKTAKDSSQRTGLTLIFAATRHHVEYIATLLQAACNLPTAQIYGTMDAAARQQNLRQFRSGQTPVLIVTDVAARGIDVPLIDHVIHYHFPSLSPKLFVHRSGRAARAGRIGFCWSLVEPDELPYMMDLHLFLGRQPTSAVEYSKNINANNSNNNGTYTLSEMTPDMVHYGSMPESITTEQVENVQRILNSELCDSRHAEALRALTKVCRNAMQQYRRTRPEASRQGVRRAKAILEGERLETGQRVGGGAIPSHPLLRGMELQRHAAAAAKNSNPQQDGKGVGNLENFQKREEFLRAMSNFRPKETVFEAFATGKGKDTAVVSHIDKGRTTKTKKHDSSAALSAMKNMRRQMRMARDRGLVIAGSQRARDANGEGSSDDEESVSEDADLTLLEQNEKLPTVGDTASLPPAAAVESRRRMSKAERRRLKKNPKAQPSSLSSSYAETKADKKAKRGADFRDPAFFIDNDFTSNSEEAQRSRFVEAAMQPLAARGSKGAALRLEETMLDIVGDEKSDLVQKQRMVRWDKSKRKYVQTTVGQELSGDSKSKKLRLESGQLVKNDKLKLGELYQKWQKKTNQSIGRSGVFDDDDGGKDVRISPSGKKKKKGGTKASKVEKDEIKTSADIRKERDKKQTLKVKNMKKSERRHLEQKQRGGSRRNDSGRTGKSKKAHH